MTALVDKLCISPENVKFLVQKYTVIQAAMCIGGCFAPAFDMHEGVQQGCPASPLVFSFFMDRLEQHLVDGVLSHLSSREIQAIGIVGLLIQQLLFADDIVFMATNPQVIYKIMDGLSDFFRDNGLTVSLNKMEWLVGGKVGGEGWRAKVGVSDNWTIRYRGQDLREVQQFKYLGLVFAGSKLVQPMIDAWVVTA